MQAESSALLSSHTFKFISEVVKTRLESSVKNIATQSKGCHPAKFCNLAGHVNTKGANIENTNLQK